MSQYNAALQWIVNSLLCSIWMIHHLKSRNVPSGRDIVIYSWHPCWRYRCIGASA
jgi:hypothetical protein